MNLGQLLESHLGWAAQKRGYNVAIPAFEKVDEDKIWSELAEAGLPASGKVRLIDGRTGEKFGEDTVVGIGYILKLIHMVEDKTHARSTGPYSLVTQQPLGGKAQMGGQRLGEMEVWALEAHRAAHLLQEMLTIKSDDVVGRAKTFEAIVKGTEIPDPTVTESFRVFLCEVKSLGLDIVPMGTEEVETVEEVDKDVAAMASEMAEELGATAVEDADTQVVDADDAEAAELIDNAEDEEAEMPEDMEPGEEDLEQVEKGAL
jgi:DNA-directed RNA polymerase subunit beta